MEIKKYKKPDAIARIQEQVVNIKTAYDLVRIDEPGIVSEVNKAVVIQMLIDLNVFAGVARKMNEAQIADTVNMLLDEFPSLSLQEYQVFFNRIKSGKFGQLYDSLDGIKIMVFMGVFYKEVNNAYHDFKEESHEQLKRIEGHRDL